MRPFCFKCQITGFVTQEGSNFVRFGFYYRSSDKKYIRRFRCKNCQSTFSLASPFLFQKKRHLNLKVAAILSSTGSQRRTAKILHINRKTVVRTFRLMASLAEAKFYEQNATLPKATIIEFDDLETFEHTKCKPLSVSLAVEHKTRRILGIEVSRMPASGLLVKRAKKYGPRPDERKYGRERLFRKIQDLVHPYAVIKSDQNPHYPHAVKCFFPNAVHKRYFGKRGSLGGQGELKKVKFDPLFSLNHTCAKMRADINRLIRKTWCTTKHPAELYRHLILFANYHNQNLPPTLSTH
jgi:hypothetical protein